MEIRWLEDFIALSETRHFSRAAEAQNVTQPTFSRRIKLLEEEMGVTLVNRNTLPLSLTPAGERFLLSSKQITEIVRQTKVECETIKRMDEDKLHFSTTQTLYLCFYSHWLKEMDSQIEMNVNLNSITWSGDDFIDALEQHKSSLMLCYWHPAIDFLERLRADHFDYHTLAVETLVPCSATDADGQPIFQLPGTKRHPIPYIGYQKSSFLAPVVQQHLQQMNTPPHLLHMNENAQAVSVKAMVKEGFGLGWLPMRLLNDSLHYKTLALAGDQHWSIPLEIRVYRSRSNKNRHLETLWQEIGHYAAQQPVLSPFYT